MFRLYDSRLSGNAWKVRILLRQLGLPFERVTLDLAKGATATRPFGKRAASARVPVLELEDGRTIVESDAILLYLAEGSPFLPDDRFFRAEVASWLLFEQADLLRRCRCLASIIMRGIAVRWSAVSPNSTKAPTRRWANSMMAVGAGLARRRPLFDR